MALHTLTPGKRVIETIAQIGRALRYVVKTEAPVERRHRPPAVDVAWFGNDEHDYPLMIFEIESSATNAMANNPVKVFGQPNEKFERPLFYFHLIVCSGADTSRVDNLKRLFGAHNYRAYQLDRGMGTNLIEDILSQHRRIYKTIDVCSLLPALMTSSELAVDSGAVLDHAATIGLRGRYLADTAILAGQYPEARELFLNHLSERLVARKWPNVDTGYLSWLGFNWSRPIHLGLLSATRPTDRASILEQLRSWQEHSSFMPSAIGPHFGLSMDYDDFIVCAAAGLWALVAALMLEHPESLKYISEQLVSLVRGLEDARPFAWPYSVTWGLHVSASARDSGRFTLMRSFANKRGGIPPRILYSPPSFLYVDDPLWHEIVTQSPEPVPGLSDFLSRRAEAVLHTERVDPVGLALSALANEEGPNVDGTSLVKLLSCVTLQKLHEVHKMPSPSGYSGTPLAKKLGIKESSHIFLVGAPEEFATLLEPLPEGVFFESHAGPGIDIAHVFVTRREELAEHLHALRKSLRPDAVLWVSWPKKASKVPTTITEDVIREVALPLGFVDVKVCAVSEIWSGLKLVVRKELR